MGIITTLLFYQYMEQTKVEKVSAVETLKVVVAKERIEQNEKITAEKIELVEKPLADVLPQTIKSLSDAEGKLANSVIEKGETVLAHHLGSEKEEGIYVSRKVTEGFRAVTVGVNINQSVSNLIEPEDEVDVVFTKMAKDPTNQPLATSVMLLEKVRVLAVGRKMLTPEQTKDPYVEYSSVTLEVKSEDALKIIKASEEGSLQFILNKRPVMKVKDNS